MGDFTFWISLSLRPVLSPKSGLRPKKDNPKSEVAIFIRTEKNARTEVPPQSFAQTEFRTERRP
jgi:hypothetical protein